LINPIVRIQLGEGDEYTIIIRELLHEFQSSISSLILLFGSIKSYQAIKSESVIGSFISIKAIDVYYL
jgi:hypothetical protein